MKLASLVRCSGVVAALIFSASSQGASLIDIYQQAAKNDYVFQAAQAELVANSEVKNISRSRLLPNIAAQAGYTQSNRTFQTEVTSDIPEGSGFTIPGANSGPTDPVDNEITNQDYGISLNQALINVADWNTYKADKISADIALFNYDAAKQDLILRAARAYFTVLEAVDILQTSQAEEKALNLQLDQTRQRFDVGLTAITDVHEAQAVFDSATANRLSAEGEVDIAFDALEVLTGQKYGFIHPLKTTFNVSKPEPSVRKNWVAFAEKNNLDYIVAKLRAKSAKFNYRAARAGHLPTLDAAVSFGSNTSLTEGVNEQFLIPETRETTREETRVSLSLNIPIFAGGRVHAQRRRAAAQLDQFSALSKQSKRAITQQTRANFTQVVTGVATVKARKQAIVSNQSALEATQAGYDVGTRDLIDVLQAQQNVFRARRDYAQALYRYINNTLTLKAVAGILKSDDIVKLDNSLNKQKNINQNTY